jgi:hypothetical protein
MSILSCSQEERVILINNSNSASLIAISANGRQFKIHSNNNFPSNQILRYGSDFLIQLKIDNSEYKYKNKISLRQLWEHYPAKDEIVISLEKNREIFLCDPKTHRPLSKQPQGFPLIPVKEK